MRGSRYEGANKGEAVLDPGTEGRGGSLKLCWLPYIGHLNSWQLEGWWGFPDADFQDSRSDVLESSDVTFRKGCGRLLVANLNGRIFVVQVVVLASSTADVDAFPNVTFEKAVLT